MYSVGRRLSVTEQTRKAPAISLGAPFGGGCSKRGHSAPLQQNLATEVYGERPSNVERISGRLAAPLAMALALPKHRATPGRARARHPAALHARTVSRCLCHCDSASPLTRERMRLGRREEYRHLRKELDRFPASVRLAAYVRAAEFALTHVRLQQSRS
jgi:hypothetical protein